MLRFLRISIAISLILSVANLCPADRWNQFRGPGGSGIADGCSPPVRIGEDSLTWRVEVPPGHSSPALSTDRIFLTAIEDDRLITLAFEKVSGRLAWRKEAPKVKIERIHETSSPASSTPYVDTNRVIVYFGSFGLICYDLDGKELWQRPIPTPRSLYGMATSPIVPGENIIMVLDNENNIEGDGRNRLGNSETFQSQRLVDTNDLELRRRARPGRARQLATLRLRSEKR